MRVWGIIARVAFIATFVVLGSGCSEQNSAEPIARSDLPTELANIQGSWVSATTNGCTDSCGAIIDGYTIRVRYQSSPDAPMERHSVSIEKIDTDKQLVVLAGGSGAWPYSYDTEGGEEHLELEFFSQENKEWRRMYLRRSSSNDS